MHYICPIYKCKASDKQASVQSTGTVQVIDGDHSTKVSAENQENKKLPRRCEILELRSGMKLGSQLMQRVALIESLKITTMFPSVSEMVLK